MIRFVFSKVTLAGVLGNQLGVGRKGPEWIWSEHLRKLWQASRQETMES